MIYNIPLWLTLLVAFFMLFSAVVTLSAALGFCFLSNYFSRLHMMSLAANLSLFSIVVAISCYFGWQEPQLIIKLALLFIFVFLTGPIGMMMLAFLGCKK